MVKEIDILIIEDDKDLVNTPNENGCNIVRM